MIKPEAMPSENLVQANKVSETGISKVSFVSMSAAFQRARTLDSMRIVQDILSRIALLFLLSGYVPHQSRSTVCVIVILFCAMWQISKLRLYDTVSQIEDNYITGAQGVFEVRTETKWEQLLIILGSRATSRRDIVVMERVLQLEPVLWGALTILVIIFWLELSVLNATMPYSLTTLENVGVLPLYRLTLIPKAERPRVFALVGRFGCLGRSRSYGIFCQHQTTSFQSVSRPRDAANLNCRA